MPRRDGPSGSTGPSGPTPILLIPGPRDVFADKTRAFLRAAARVDFAERVSHPCRDAEGHAALDLDQGHALALGLVPLGRPPQFHLAPGLRPALRARLCRRPRGRAHQGDEPLQPVLEAGRAMLSPSGRRRAPGSTNAAAPSTRSGTTDRQAAPACPSRRRPFRRCPRHSRRKGGSFDPPFPHSEACWDLEFRREAHRVAAAEHVVGRRVGVGLHRRRVGRRQFVEQVVDVDAQLQVVREILANPAGRSNRWPEPCRSCC